MKLETKSGRKENTIQIHLVYFFTVTLERINNLSLLESEIYVCIYSSFNALNSSENTALYDRMINE
jgi:hypothetical protein